MSLVGEAEKLIESTAKGMIGSRSTKVPFADQTIYVSCHRERISQCLFR